MQTHLTSLADNVALAAVLIGVLVLSGCDSSSGDIGAKNKDPRQTASDKQISTTSPGGAPMQIPATIKVTSTAFDEGQRIPVKYTGEGVDVSPPIQWENLPEGTQEIVLICDDPDAPSAEPWVHWVIYKIPAGVSSLPEGVARKARLIDPPGVLQGQNSWPSDNLGYRGPMPPPGSPHRYYFRVYALEARLSVEPRLPKHVLLQEIEGHVLATGELMGTFER